jgi:5'-3' exonuclease
MRTALLDADIIVWKACACGQDKINLGGEIIKRPNWRKMWQIANGMVERWTAAVEADQFLLCVTDRHKGVPLFRASIAEDYKANRKDLPRPDLLLELHWRLVEKYDGMFHPGLEGDDILGILATSGDYGECVIVSEDKDMWSIPCGVYLPTRSKEIRWVSEVTANRYWFRQAMIGDTIDHYKGCHMIGKERARLLLAGTKTIDEMWRRTLDAFLQHGHTEEYALQQLRLARILRAEDIDGEWEKIRLWHPRDPEWFTLPVPSERPLSSSELVL